MSTLDASFPHFFQLQSGESKEFHELMFQQPLTSRIMEVDDVTTLNTFSVLDNGSRTFFFASKEKKGHKWSFQPFLELDGHTMERTEKNEQAGEVARYGP